LSDGAQLILSDQLDMMLVNVAGECICAITPVITVKLMVAQRNQE
jgi:hypothetical protein